MIFGNLSHLPDAVIEPVRLALSGKSLVPAEAALRVLRSRPHGHVAAVLGTVQSLGIERLFSPRRSPNATDVSWAAVSSLADDMLHANTFNLSTWIP